MSWRLLTFFIVLCMAAASLMGAMLGYWLVEAAPMLPEQTLTAKATNAEPVLDAEGRPLTGVPPQPLTDGTLGMPRPVVQPMWEIQHVTMFDVNLDPMVSLAIGQEGFTISDVLSQAGAGLAQAGGDIATVDIAQAGSDRNTQATDAASWHQDLEKAIRACDKVGFFSRPGCIDRAQRRYCAPNNAWGRHPLCPSQQPNVPSGA